MGVVGLSHADPEGAAPLTLALRTAVSELVYRSALALDDLDFAGFLGLCAPGFRYQVGAYSPEIRRRMVWLDHDREGMATLFETLPRHNSNLAPLTRHVTVYTVDPGERPGEVRVVSALQVFRTGLDGGATELFAVGRQRDLITVAGDPPRLLGRDIDLTTRMLGIGSHIPF